MSGIRDQHRAAMINLFYNALNRKAALKAAFLQKHQRRVLIFADDIYRYLSIDIGLQVDFDNVLTDGAQGAFRHANFAFLDVATKACNRVTDVGDTDGTE